MDSYLLETSILTISLDARHPRHDEVLQSIAALPADSNNYVSVIGLAELEFGANLAEAIGRQQLPVLREKIRNARNHAVLDVTPHTATAYAAIKSKLAVKFLASTLRRDRPRYVEEWIDKATGKALGIDENDLWMCAQAKERGIVLVTADRRIRRVAEADHEIRFLFV